MDILVSYLLRYITVNSHALLLLFPFEQVYTIILLRRGGYHMSKYSEGSIYKNNT